MGPRRSIVVGARCDARACFLDPCAGAARRAGPPSPRLRGRPQARTLQDRHGTAARPGRQHQRRLAGGAAPSGTSAAVRQRLRAELLDAVDQRRRAAAAAEARVVA